MVQVFGVQWYNVGVEMVRCSGSAQQCLTSAAGFDFATFVAAWLWGSCETVFLWFSVFNVFLLNMFLAFFIMICSLCSFYFHK